MRYIKKKQINSNCALGYAALSLQMRIFPPEMEEELTKHIVFMADMYFDLSPEKCKELAFEFAMKNKLPIPQSWKDNRKAGIQWWISFKQRHNLSTLPIPKAAPRKRSLTRSRGKTSIYTDTPFRDEVEKKSIEKKIKPTKINAKRKLFVKQGKRNCNQLSLVHHLKKKKTSHMKKKVKWIVLF